MKKTTLHIFVTLGAIIFTILGVFAILFYLDCWHYKPTTNDLVLIELLEEKDWIEKVEINQCLPAYWLVTVNSDSIDVSMDIALTELYWEIDDGKIDGWKFSFLNVFSSKGFEYRLGLYNGIVEQRDNICMEC